PEGLAWEDARAGLVAAGFSRVLGPEGAIPLDELAAAPRGTVTVVQDRVRVQAGTRARLVESLEHALVHGRGRAAVVLPDRSDRCERFSTALDCAACGFVVREPVPNL